MRKLAAALVLVGLGCGGNTPPPDSPPQGGVAEPTPPAAESAAAAATAAAAVAPPPPAAASASASAAAKSPADDAPLLGKLGDAEIQDTLSKNFSLFDPCYPEALKKKNGTIKATVKATIGPNGTANVVTIFKPSGDAKVDACVVDAFKKIKFPVSKEGSARVNPLSIELGGQMVMTK